MDTHLGAHLQLDDFYPVRYDGRLVAFVKGRLEHLDSICVKLVGEAWPFEREGHRGEVFMGRGLACVARRNVRVMQARNDAMAVALV